jgi:AcrR family transcriptional regulator
MPLRTVINRKAPASASGEIGARPAKRAYHAERREEQKRLTQARVLESALALFAERGFEATSLRDIAARAGVSHAAIGGHFGSKAMLWRKTADFLFARMSAEMQRRPGEPPFEDGAAGVEWFIRRYVEYCARHPEHARLMLMESMHDSDQLQYAVERHIRPAHEFLAGALRNAMAAGAIDEADAANMIYIVAAASQSVFALAHEARHVYGVDVTSDEFVAHHADTLVRLIVRR